MSVLGSGPFEFTDLRGNQASIPLGQLVFNSSGNAEVDGSWPPLSGYSGDQKDVIAKFLADQQKGELFSKAPVVSPKPAVVFTAADKGTLGNEIEITITTTPGAGGDPFDAKFDVTAEQSESYPGLKLDTIADVLGTDTTDGSQPGLAIVIGTVGTELPAEITDEPFDAASQLKVLDAVDPVPGTAFTLEARKKDPDTAFLLATVKDVDDGAGTFTLDLKWRRTVTNAKLATIAADLAALDYLVTVAPPAPDPFGVPKSVTSLALSGGTDTANASAVVTAL